MNEGNAIGSCTMDDMGEIGILPSLSLLRLSDAALGRGLFSGWGLWLGEPLSCLLREASDLAPRLSLLDEEEEEEETVAVAMDVEGWPEFKRNGEARKSSSSSSLSSSSSSKKLLLLPR